MPRNVFSFLIVFFLGLPGQIHADFTTPGIEASSRGSVLANGSYGGPGNYFAGISSGNSDQDSRDYFNFKLKPSDNIGTVTSAYLLLQNPFPADLLGTSFGRLDFFGLGSTTPTFSDIGAGTKYTKTPVTSANQSAGPDSPNFYVRVDLNAAALAAITDAAKNNSVFSLGGVCSLPGGITDEGNPIAQVNGGFFAFTTNNLGNFTTQLFITSVPEPPSWIIALSGLACFFSVNWIAVKSN